MDPRAAFDQFFLDEHPRLVAMVRALTGDLGQAEDIAQEALLRAHQRWDQVAYYQRPGAWTRRVALNLVTSARRRSGTERRTLGAIGRSRAGGATDADRSSGLDPVADAVAEADVWSVVRTLPPQQAKAIVAYYLADESIADLAVTLDCAEGTAKAHLHQARAALALRLRLSDEDQP